MKKYILYIVFLLANLNVWAQDFHWSQYQATPFYVNPAYTGMFDVEHFRKTIRASINWRQQWRTIRGPYSEYATPFSSYSFALDGNISNLSFLGEDVIGLGIAVFKDEAGDLNFSTVQYNMYMAYHKSLQQREDRFLSLGMYYGRGQKYLDFSKASFDSQWDGTQYIPGSSTGENFLKYNQGFGDFSVGLSHHLFPHYGVVMRSGISALHLNHPYQDIYNNKDRLKTNWILNHDMSIPIKSKWEYMPSFLFMHQNPATEFVLYNALRMSITKDQYHQFGLGYRIVGNYKNPVDQDALYLTYKLGYNKWSFGFSYDVNVSSLNDATSTIGAFEIAIIYHDHPFMKPRDKHRRSKLKCPDIHPVERKSKSYFQF